jgi:hypothetical protein
MADATILDLLGTDIHLHYDVSDAALIFEDTSGTDAAEDGDVVKCLKPTAHAVLAVNLTEATNGPTYAANYSGSGYPAIVFDGTNDLLRNGSTGATAGRFFGLCVLTPVGVGRVWARGNSTTAYSSLYINSSTVPRYQSHNGTTLTDLTITTSGRVCVAQCFGANQQQIDGLGASSGTSSATSPVHASLAAELTLGALWTGSASQFGSVAFHELLIIGGSCEWGQVLRAAKLLRTKWGITDPNGTPQSASGGGIPIARGMHGGMR